MQALTLESARPPVPPWLWATAAAGVLWNGYGVAQWAGSFGQTAPSLMAAGMTAAQAQAILALPVWVSVVFAVGVFGGLLGSVALALARAQAVPVFGASLLGYGLLFAGDAHHGVFAAMPGQMALLALVVTIAAALCGAAVLARRRGLLR